MVDSLSGKSSATGGRIAAVIRDEAAKAIKALIFMSDMVL